MQILDLRRRQLVDQNRHQTRVLSALLIKQRQTLLRFSTLKTLKYPVGGSVPACFERCTRRRGRAWLADLNG